MKAKILLILVAIVSFAFIFFVMQSDDVDFKPMTIEELNPDIQNAIYQIEASGVYFIIQEDTTILYSSLGKSGMYTYPFAEIKQNDGKLTIKINSKSSPSDQDVQEGLIGRIDIKKLPEDIEISFLGQAVDYKIINLDQ